MSEKLGYTVEEAGRKGGETTRQRHGREHYVEIGKKGGKRTSANRDHMRKIGRMGGKARGKEL